MRLTVFICISVFLFSACEKNCTDNLGTLSLSFNPTYMRSPYVIYDVVPASNADFTDFSLSRFEFFIYGLTLHSESDSLLLSTAEYINMTGLNTSEKVAQGFVLEYDSLSPASYNRLSFTVGLPDAINNTSPDQYSTQSPLGAVSNYWAGWNSYIFSKLEGNITRNDSSSGSYLIHSGVNGMSVQRTFDLPIEILMNENATIDFTVAIDSLFYAYNQVLNVDTSNMSHSGAMGSESYNIAKQSLSNISKSITTN